MISSGVDVDDAPEFSLPVPEPKIEPIIACPPASALDRLPAPPEEPEVSPEGVPDALPVPEVADDGPVTSANQAAKFLVAKSQMMNASKNLNMAIQTASLICPRIVAHAAAKSVIAIKKMNQRPSGSFRKSQLSGFEKVILNPIRLKEKRRALWTRRFYSRPDA